MQLLMFQGLDLVKIALFSVFDVWGSNTKIVSSLDKLLVIFNIDVQVYTACL